MSRRNLISSFVLGLACGLIALPTPALADRDTPAPSASRPGPPPTSSGRKGVSAGAPTGPQPAAGAIGASGAGAERARLAAELARINAEIDALKRSPRGIRDDYRLRSRMADAEAVARRLTELEARGGPMRAPESAAAPGVWPREVPVQPADDRADLEAKADIIADQARRLTAEANRIETRVVDLRARRELRRRAGQLERDPFSPLEQPKPRVLAVGTAASVSQSSGGSKNVSGPPRTGEGASPASGASTPTTSTPGPSGGPPTSLTDSAGGTTPSNMSVSGVTSPQAYGALDPTMLAEIRRLDAAGAPSANIGTLEAAIATLRARSTELTRTAAALRARAAQRAY